MIRNRLSQQAILAFTLCVLALVSPLAGRTSPAVAAGGGWSTSGDESILDHPDALARAHAALRNPNAGEVLVSAAPGFEFADLGGRHHAGGGSHGSLATGDSIVPMLVVGLERVPGSIVDVAPAVLEHFGLRRDAARAA